MRLSMGLALLQCIEVAWEADSENQIDSPDNEAAEGSADDAPVVVSRHSLLFLPTINEEGEAAGAEEEERVAVAARHHT